MNNIYTKLNSFVRWLFFMLLLFMGFVFAFDKHPIAYTHMVSDYNESVVNKYDDEDVSDKRKFQMLCLDNLFMCVKVNFVDNFNYTEKYKYLKQSIRVLSVMNQNLLDDNAILKGLGAINLLKGGDDKRGYTSANKVNINVSLIGNEDEFLGVLTHELFHIFDIKLLNGNSHIYDRNYTEFGGLAFFVDDPSLDYYKLSWVSENSLRETSSSTDFCSLYGRTDTFEDLAECGNLYLNHNALFRYLAQKNIILQKKYDWFAKLFGNNYISLNTDDLLIVKNDLSKRVWDTTKM